MALVVKNSPAPCRRCRRRGFGPWIRKISWREAWQPTPVFLPGESRGQKSLAGYSPWGCRVGHNWSDLAHMLLWILNYSLDIGCISLCLSLTWGSSIWLWSMRTGSSVLGEGDSTPLQYSCLENPRDGGAWRAAVYGVAQSRTRLKWLSSSSSSVLSCLCSFWQWDLTRVYTSPWKERISFTCS